MKKLILTILLPSIVLTSCNTNEKKSTTKNAEKVTVTNTESTKQLHTIGKDSFVKWSASHLGGVKQRFGKVFVKDATFWVTEGKLTNANVVMDLGSLTVESFPEGSKQTPKLESHLKSADFFNIEKFPTATFELVKIEQAEGNFNSKITGNLTISGITKSITFNANVKASDEAVSIKSEDFTVNRADWNLTYHAKGSKGIPVDYLIADDIGFTINVSATK